MKQGSSVQLLGLDKEPIPRIIAEICDRGANLDIGAAMTKEQEQKEEQNFTVTDKRGFREDGEPKAPEPDVKDKGEEKPSAEQASAKKEKPPEQKGSSKPSIDFPSYILSYYTQGLVLLGEVPNPMTNKKEEHTEEARHIIDILAMLEEKTKGNLTDAEKQLIETVLYELRMKFMAKTNRIKI